MEENLDKLQISDDAITERAGDDKLISKEAGGNLKSSNKHEL